MILKRTLDILVALLGLLAFSPLMILVSILIYFDLGLPILFKQERPGYKCRLFNIYKFRTMKHVKDKNNNLIEDEKRLTNLGKILRKSSIDELPSFFNVLLNDMSLVGPRPLLVEYLELYSGEENRRHDVKPGITGWAQINGRNNLTWSEKLRLDVWYVDNQSFYIDFKIILNTIYKVFKMKDINQEGHATAEKFKGSKNEEN